MTRHLLLSSLLILSLLVACSDDDTSSVDAADLASGVDTAAEDTMADDALPGDVLPVDGSTDSQEAIAPPAPPFDWCLPDTPPDTACHASKRDPGSEQVALALAIADKHIASHPPEEMSWNWEEAVLMWSLVELYQVTGEERLFDYYKAWIDHHLEAGYEIGSSDRCSPSAVAVMLYAQTGDDKYAEVYDDALYYLTDVAFKTEEGGISHLGFTPIVTLWVDSLFMFGNVLIGWGETQDDADALAMFSEQYGIFQSVLQDEVGFFRHAYEWVIEPPEPVYWARGDSWVVASAYQYLRVLLNQGTQDEVVQSSVQALVDAVVAAQDQATGLWWTILDHPGEFYVETSASALFAYGMARGWRYGLLGDEYLPTIAAAVQGVEAAIEIDGDGVPTVTGISGPTSAGLHEDYGEVPFVDDIPYGLGAVILMLTETSGLPLEEVQ